MYTVAIILPVYATPENKRLPYFEQAIRSFTRQNLANTNAVIVGIVVDDGSEEDVESAVKQCKDSRIRYSRRERKPDDLATLSNAMNFGIELCLNKSKDVFTSEEADEIAALTYLCSDDLLRNGSIEKRLGKLSRDTSFVYSDFAMFSDKNGMEYIKKMDFEPDVSKILRKCRAFNFPHPTSMWEINFLQKIKEFVGRKYGQQGVFDSTITQREDIDSSLSTFETAFQLGFGISYVPAVSYFTRMDTGGISSNGTEAEKIYYEHLVQEKHGTADEQLKTAKIMGNLKDDLPWSLGIYLPEKIKPTLRPIKQFIKPILFRLQHKELVTELSDLLN